jgi:hypothetical protein
MKEKIMGNKSIIHPYYIRMDNTIRMADRLTAARKRRESNERELYQKTKEAEKEKSGVTSNFRLPQA